MAKEGLLYKFFQNWKNRRLNKAANKLVKDNPGLEKALKDWDNALNWCDILNERDPHSRFLGWRAAILGMKGKIDDAQECLILYLNYNKVF